MTRPSSSLLSLLPGHLKLQKTSQWLWHFSVMWHVEFGQSLEIDSAETTCLWNSLSLLGKVEVFGTQVSVVIWWNLFVEARYQIAFTSIQKLWTMSTNASKITTSAQNFNCILILAENLSSCFLNKASWKFTFFPLQFENGLSHFPAVRRESFFRTIISREKEREREQHIWQSTGMKVSPSS